MKNIREMTDVQAATIADLALAEILTWDLLISLKHGHRPKTAYRVERELWDEKENLMVVRVYVDGMPDVYCAIWEGEYDVNVYEGAEEKPHVHQVEIVKKLIEWEFV